MTLQEVSLEVLIMKALIQRVMNASVTVDGTVCGKIENGFLIFLGVFEGDDELDADVLCDKVCKMRIFEDENGKMNRSLLDFQNCEEPYKILCVSQFTLCANYKHGNRPDFLSAGKPERANELYEYFMQRARDKFSLGVESGIFGADMKVSLINDGPVTIMADSRVLLNKANSEN